ncbi:MAG TPA: PhzF family phenazine biosynthesis protein [Aggregatilineales bacterium]|nr:PhzF family phenazine biosynthesis protein [Aggregatilineales bacterium]
MPSYRFYQVDVFTDQPFGGNPLAVFPDAQGLDSGMMQRIAREMNLSETTFVFPPDSADADYTVRIFTPMTEMPFAGHPVVGTQWVLAHTGRTKLTTPVTTVRFQLQVGIRAVALHVEGNRVTRVVMDHQKPEFFATATADQVARLERALGLRSGGIDTEFPVQVVSSGNKNLFIPVRTLADVSRLDPGTMDASALIRLCGELDPASHCHYCVMVLTRQTTGPAINLHTRMFAHGVGIPEDPATGSSAGGLGAYVIENRYLPATPPMTTLVSEQGLEMGRPSRLTTEVDGAPGAISMIRVAGQVVPMIEGTLAW